MVKDSWHPADIICALQKCGVRLAAVTRKTGPTSIACAVARIPLCTLCPLSLWRPTDKRPSHTFWRVTPPQRQFFTFPLCMIHINAP